jgi:hypothetical protein
MHSKERLIQIKEIYRAIEKPHPHDPPSPAPISASIESLGAKFV